MCDEKVNFREEKNSCFLSVIVPVYNVEEYLVQCIESIVHQSYQDWELILVDDGSTDGSGNICDTYARKYNNVFVIHQHNQGHTSARLRGVRESVGKYISLIDSDDWLDLDMYEEMCKRADQYDADIVQCDFKAIQGEVVQNAVSPYPDGIYDRNTLEENVFPCMIYNGGFFKAGIAPNMWNKIFKRELLERCLNDVPLEIESGEDGLVTYRAFLESEKIYLIKTCFYNYRSRNVSMCRILDDKRIFQNHLLFEEYKRKMLTYDKYGLEKQVAYYIVYQTLQILDATFEKDHTLLEKMKCIIAKCLLIRKWDFERRCIRMVPINRVKGRRNQIYLLLAKCLTCI